MDYLKQMGYLKGLAEGMSLDGNTKEGKILLAVIDLLDDMVDDISNLHKSVDLLDDNYERISDEIDEVGETIEDLSCLVNDWQLDLEDMVSEHGGGDIRVFHGGNSVEEEEEEIEEEEDCVYQLSCPFCGKDVIVHEEQLEDGNIVCPGCDEFLEFEIRSCCDDEDCGCSGCGNAAHSCESTGDTGSDDGNGDD